MKILVSGLINIETTLNIKAFPINYFPIDYPFYGIKSDIGGVAYNVSKAFITLGNEVELASFIGKDEEGTRILSRLEADGIGSRHISQALSETPASIILFDNDGKRQIYCDLKDIQEQGLDSDTLESQIASCDIVVACNTNFNRSLLRKAKELGKLIASDVHVLSDLNDEYNKDFMQYADILFLSNEKLPCKPETFLHDLKNKYQCKVAVIGMGVKGALLYDRSTDKIYNLEAAKATDVVNTVGAGDSLFTSFLHYYGKGYSPIEALKRAEIFAAIKIGYNGASLGFSDEKTIEKHYQECEISLKEITSF